MGAAEPEGARGLGRGGGDVLNGMDITSSSDGSDVVFDLGMGMLDVRDGLPAMVGDENKVEYGEFEGGSSNSKCAQTSAVSRKAPTVAWLYPCGILFQPEYAI